MVQHRVQAELTFYSGTCLYDAPQLPPLIEASLLVGLSGLGGCTQLSAATSALSRSLLCINKQPRNQQSSPPESRLASKQ